MNILIDVLLKEYRVLQGVSLCTFVGNAAYVTVFSQGVGRDVPKSGAIRPKNKCIQFCFINGILSTDADKRYYRGKQEFFLLEVIPDNNHFVLSL